MITDKKPFSSTSKLAPAYPGSVYIDNSPVAGSTSNVAYITSPQAFSPVSYHSPVSSSQRHQ